MKQTTPYILMLEDDIDDRHLTQAFFAERGYQIGLEFFSNSDEVLPFPEQCLDGNALLPRLVLLDKNAPASGGMNVLVQIKSHPVLSSIPVVMISGTAFQEEINESYRLGVNSFIAKPLFHHETQKTIETFVNYWFGTVALPQIPKEMVRV